MKSPAIDSYRIALETYCADGVESHLSTDLYYSSPWVNEIHGKTQFLTHLKSALQKMKVRQIFPIMEIQGNRLSIKYEGFDHLKSFISFEIDEDKKIKRISLSHC